MDLQVSIIEEIAVIDVVSIGRAIVKLVLNLRKVVKQDIKRYLEIVSNVNSNGPPTLGVSVADSSEVKAIFG